MSCDKHETFIKVKEYQEKHGCPFCKIEELEELLTKHKNLIIKWVNLYNEKCNEIKNIKMI